MTPCQTELVRTTFRSVLPIGDQAAALFFVRLFELHPALRPLFQGEIGAQGRKLIDWIGHVVLQLDRPEEVVHTFRAGHARELAVRLRDEDYDAIALALRWTLRQVLGAAFSPPVEAAWVAAHRLLSETARSAGANQRAA
jgi:hemoglobin-like flavoprotein